VRFRYDDELEFAASWSRRAQAVGTNAFYFPHSGEAAALLERRLAEIDDLIATLRAKERLQAGQTTIEAAREWLPPAVANESASELADRLEATRLRIAQRVAALRESAQAVVMRFGVPTRLSAAVIDHEIAMHQGEVAGYATRPLASRRARALLAALVDPGAPDYDRDDVLSAIGELRPYHPNALAPGLDESTPTELYDAAHAFMTARKYAVLPTDAAQALAAVLFRDATKLTPIVVDPPTVAAFRGRNKLSPALARNPAWLEPPAGGVIAFPRGMPRLHELLAVMSSLH
jgi:hypothetical protein